jgi:hypothetical protein
LLIASPRTFVARGEAGSKAITCIDATASKK